MSRGDLIAQTKVTAPEMPNPEFCKATASHPANCVMAIASPQNNASSGKVISPQNCWFEPALFLAASQEISADAGSKAACLTVSGSRRKIIPRIA
ncbi:hypothetical protein [Paracoccus sp. JM45]|uniref:hypothetical protein n=1 Tax=Paracoccus sp. JM45 TaxID=2283626 RepID=UPI0015FF6A92|nr:hypothetical protein [Paracoccus sp. JM45]